MENSTHVFEANKRKRFHARLEKDGTSTIFDIFTGEPAYYIGKTMWKLDADLAKTFIHLLNCIDLRRRAELGI